METVYIGIGSNLGDRLSNLREAVDALQQLAVNDVEASSIYETEPFGVDVDQPRYLNMVVRLETDLSAEELLETLLEIERKFGRVRRARNEARTLDLDILLYGSAIVDSAPLTIPHPRMHERAFVLMPLAEIAPDLTHPITGISIAASLAAVDVAGVVRLNEPISVATAT